MSRNPGCNLSPRGDGNIVPRPLDPWLVCCNLSPRGDGNQLGLSTNHPEISLQFIPARGRKPQRVDKLVKLFCCNLSPRGDGNSARRIFLRSPLLLQFIPARGRKPQRQEAPLPPASVAIYPREGTETSSVVIKSVGSLGCNLSPRGDGNFAVEWLKDKKGKLQFIPARGRKPARIFEILHPKKLQFIPARGRKHSLHAIRPNLPQVAIYPREGTKTCTV